MKYLGPKSDLDNWPFLDIDLDEGILSITLNGPEQHNTISTGMSLVMGQILAVISGDESVRVLVVSSKSDSFCKGFEVSELLDETPINNVHAKEWQLLPQPVIAMVHGQCRAGAIALIKRCDIVICADDTCFALNDQSFDAIEAQHNGLVTFSVPASELQAQTHSLARELASKDTLALRFTKETLQRVSDIPWDEVLAFTSSKQAELKTLQAGRPSARASAIESFLAGKSKPGAGA